MQKVIRIKAQDNVAVALETLIAGQEVIAGMDHITLSQDIAAGHKFAVKDLSEGSEVIKYGYPIGRTTKPIDKGEWVHTHNITTGLEGTQEYSYHPELRSSENRADPKLSRSFLKDLPVSFEGYIRENGKAGIRNEIFIVPTVGCVNDVARLLEKKGREYLNDAIDELIAFTHPYGCSQLGDDQKNTQKILSGLIDHPNAAGVLVLGLGCENNSIAEMQKLLKDYPEGRIKFLECQEADDEIEEGLQLIKELVHFASGYKKEKVPVSELIIGLKCGGSDGYSGITANPLVGVFSDLIIDQGGTTILTEVPEMFGAETILMNRCADKSLFDRTVDLINGFKRFYSDHGQPIYENPSPGNKKGGISTLEDKSLGCTQKSGSTLVTGVLEYGDRVQQRGLLLLGSPGNDLVASTALAAAGAHIILFTTGRGTPFGAPVPTIKISSNSGLATKKKDWIDFDAGQLLNGKSMEELAQELYGMVIAVASGAKVKSEECGYHDIAIFKQGVTL